MRDDDLNSMQRAVLQPDGMSGVLNWLARRLQAKAVLLDAAGRPAVAVPDCPDGILRAAAGDIRRVLGGTCAAASVAGPSWWARIMYLGEEPGGPALLITSGTALSTGEGSLIGHAAALLQLRWQADQRGRALDELREAVLHLLMAGQVSAARRVAAAVGPALPDVIRVYLIEGPAAARNKIAAWCDAACGGRAWVIRCPVYRRHVIVLAPAGDAPGLDDQQLLAHCAVSDQIAVGAGEVVGLRDTAAGYGQASHALAAARHSPGRYARFAEGRELVDFLGQPARRWAERVLRPLLGYRPPRAQDPDGGELLATLQSWLDFHGLAWRQLRIHRNTLLARIRRIEAVLGCDLTRLPVQAELHLALQLLGQPGEGHAGHPPAAHDLAGHSAGDQDHAPVLLAEVLAAPAARQWAGLLLAPLAAAGSERLLATVRAWLAADARPEVAASELGITARGVRRRLAAAEQRMGRSLTGGPSVRYDLLLALRIRDGPLPARVARRP